MILTITSIELKSPFKFFSLSYKALRIIKQLKDTRVVAKKTTGVWTMHYTMTLWNTEEELKNFARSGAHLEAMKKSAEIAKEIRTLTMESGSLPGWKEAKRHLLEMGKIYKF